jgi:hypothetical protein
MKNRHSTDHLIEDVRDRQRNTLWPDAMVNSSSADDLLWKGSAKATKVQRVGVALFGLAFACFGGIWEMIGFEEHSRTFAVAGLISLALGAKVFLNAFKRNPGPTKTKRH